MTPQRPLRSPLLALLGSGVLVLACSDAATSGGLSTPYHHVSGDGTGTGTGGSTGGATTGSGSPGAAAGGSSAATGGSSGTGAGSGGGTATTPGQGTGTGTSGSGTGTGTGTGTGGGTGTGTPTPPVTPPAPIPAAFTVNADNPAPSVNLADSSIVNVTVAPQSWSGAVTLTVTGLPSDVTGTFDNATVNLEGTAPVTAKLTLKSLSSSAPVATPFTIVGTVGEVVHNVAATLTVKPYITINIPVNADSMTGSFGTVTIKAPQDIANNPVTVNFVNLDSTAHEIHADDGSVGFKHGGGTFGQGEADTPVRKVTATGTYKWHLHDDAPPNGPPGGTVIIQ